MILKILFAFGFISLYVGVAHLEAQKDTGSLNNPIIIKKVIKDTQLVDVLLVIDGATFGTINLADIQTPHGSKNTFLSGIDLKDIATLNILKGAAGIKKYGEKAKAGVLVITTKSGKYTNENWRIRE